MDKPKKNDKRGEVIRLNDVIRGEGHEIIRIDKVIEKGMSNPSEEMKDSFLNMKKAEFGFILAEAKRDYQTLKKIREKRLANGEKEESEEMRKIEAKMERIKKVIEMGEESRNNIWAIGRDKLKNAINDFRKSLTLASFETKENNGTEVHQAEIKSEPTEKGLAKKEVTSMSLSRSYEKNGELTKVGTFLESNLMEGLKVVGSGIGKMATESYSLLKKGGGVMIDGIIFLPVSAYNLGRYGQIKKPE